MKYLLIILSLSSCVWLTEPQVSQEELRPFVDMVYYEADIRGVYIKPIRVTLGDIDDKKGRFKHGILKNEEIIISRSFFFDNIEYAPDEIEQTIFHEFGHYLGRNHKNEEIDHCKPISIMCTECCFIDYYERRTELLNELFKKEPM